MLLISIFPILLLTIIYSVYWTITPYQESKQRFLSSHHAIVSYIASTAEFAVFYSNTDLLQILAKSTIKNPEIDGVIFADSNGLILYQLGDLGPQQKTARLTDPTRLNSQKTLQSDLIWYFNAPIISSDLDVSDYDEADDSTAERDIVGHVVLVVSSEDTVLAQQKMLFDNIALSLGCMLAAIFLSMRLSRAVSNPINILSKLTDEMALGKFDQRAPKFDLQELEKLGGSFNDMTARIEQSNRILSQRITDATRELQEKSDNLQIQNDQLEETQQQLQLASEVKDQFLAQMSHELRTPLTTVIGFNKLLNKTPVADQQKEYLRAIDQASTLLLALIDDILDVSKIRSSSIELEKRPFDLMRCIEDTLSMHAHTAQKKNIELVLLTDSDVPPVIVGDSLRLKQVFNNLISNAIKFTPQGDVVITLAICNNTQQAPTLVARVKDTGIGISAAQQQQLFQPFSQADNSISRRFGGSGLGLVICRQLIELMGGSISLESVEDQGTTIEFKLPLELISATVSLTSSQTQLISHQHALLIYEPHSLARRALRSMALQWSSVVYACGNQQALSLQLQETNYHCLILSVGNTINQNDIALTELLTTARQYHAGPILLLSTIDETVQLASNKLLKSQANIRCLSKPLRQQVMFEFLDSLINIHTVIKSPQQLAPLSGYQILIAEDNTLNSNLLNQLIRAAGASCEVVSNGSEAIAACNDKYYDAILMDMYMPETDGPTATNIIRNNSRRNADSFIIGLTASTLQKDIVHFMASGANQVLAKPLDEELLLSLLATLKPQQTTVIEAQSYNGFLAQSISSQQYKNEIKRLLPAIEAAWADGSIESMFDPCHQLLAVVDAAGSAQQGQALRRLHDAIQLQEGDAIATLLATVITLLETAL
ncbi:MAG: two-component system sensor histidine kinase BarA [Oceanicoccus sp.]|jgi:two-component system sensor histidine kinase BarA